MMGKPIGREAKLFYVGFQLDDRVPSDHPLRRVDAAVDFSFVRGMVADAYGYNGNVSLDPTLILKLLFLFFYENVRSERELMRQLPLRLDWMWFCGLNLDDAIPDHSVLSKARRRWGPERFESIFEHVLHLCREAGLIGDETLHADSTLLKADASLDGRVSRRLWEQLESAARPDADQEADRDDHDDPDGPIDSKHIAKPASPKKPRLNERLVSPVDPDAATTTRKKVGTLLGYRDHRTIDDRCGIITATLATPADRDDGVMLPALLAKHESSGQARPREMTGDSMYGTRSNYDLLARKRIKGYLKKRRGKDSPKVSWLSLLPAGCTRSRALELMGRRRTCAEGRFAEAHIRMNHRRCRWRGLWRVQIQCHLVALVQNVKKLAKAVSRRQVAAQMALIRSCAWQQTAFAACVTPKQTNRCQPLSQISGQIGRWLQIDR